MTIETSYINFIANLFEYLGLDDSKDEIEVIQLAESLDQYIESTGASLGIPISQIKSQKLLVWELVDEYLTHVENEGKDLINSPCWLYSFIYNSQFVPRKERTERLIETVSILIRAIEPLERSFFKQANSSNTRIDLRPFFTEVSNHLRQLKPSQYPYQPKPQTPQMSLTYQKCPYQHKLIYRLGCIFSKSRGNLALNRIELAPLTDQVG
jgi:hypothetical protein